MQVGEVKSKFSEVLKQVSSGEQIAISYGKKREKVAVIVPFSEYSKTHARTLGLLQKKATMKINSTFQVSDDELLRS
jgi:prevent-host-death family protein